MVLAVAAGTVVAQRAGLPPFSDGCDGDPVRLSVAAAPDIAPAVRAAAAHARAERVTSDGHCLDVRVSERSGADVAAALGHGEDPDYDVWLPDSSLWVEEASASSGAPPLEAAGSVASSPLTLAAVPRAAKRMGWPEKTYSWPRIAASSAEDGAVRVGSADPARSATGLLALTRIQNAASAGKGKKGDAETAAAAKLLAERTAPGDSQVLATLPRDTSGAEMGNPKRNQALLLSEQAAYAHNRAHQGAPGLRLFYPDGGLTLLDYPYTLVDSESLGTERSRAAIRFQTLLGDEPGRRVLARHGFRAADGSAPAGLARRAGARDPQPYRADAAEPPSARSVSAAQGMWTITVQSARLTLTVDASASMSAPVPGRDGQSRMDVTKASLIQGLSQFTPDDEFGLWDFATRLDGGHDYRRLVPTSRLGDRAEGGGTHRDELTSAFSGLAPIPGGATGLYDTVLAAYKDAHKTYTEGKFNALVVLTDGANEDPGSISRGALVAELKRLGGERRVPVVAIAVGPDADAAACEEIAEATGGSSYRIEDPAQINAVILKAIMAAGSRAG
nr:substrate-binding domain-containing protein [Streptomyces sp. HNM0574]